MKGLKGVLKVDAQYRAGISLLRFFSIVYHVYIAGSATGFDVAVKT